MWRTVERNVVGAATAVDVVVDMGLVVWAPAGGVLIARDLRLEVVQPVPAHVHPATLVPQVNTGLQLHGALGFGFRVLSTAVPGGARPTCDMAH